MSPLHLNAICRNNKSNITHTIHTYYTGYPTVILQIQLTSILFIGNINIILLCYDNDV